MRGSEPYRQCWCRDPATGNPLRAKCPKLKNKKHGKWYARYDAGGTEGKRRQPVVGPFDTKKECEDELASALARIGCGGSAPDRKLRVAAYLDAYIAGKRNLKPRTVETDSDAFRLYWKPALGICASRMFATTTFQTPSALWSWSTGHCPKLRSSRRRSPRCCSA